MNIKQLEQGQKIYSELKTLDSEIIEIEKMAMLIADGNAEVNLSLSIKDLTPKQEESEKVHFDEDGSLKPFSSGILNFQAMMPSISIFHERMMGLSDKVGAVNMKHDSASVLRSKLSDNLSLNVLAILLYDKQEKRKKLLKSLKRMGVQF